MTSSRLRVTLLVWRNSPPITGTSCSTGTPLRSSRVSCSIRPPIATICPSFRRTMLSVSLTVLAASGSL